MMVVDVGTDHPGASASHIFRVVDFQRIQVFIDMDDKISAGHVISPDLLAHEKLHFSIVPKRQGYNLSEGLD